MPSLAEGRIDATPSTHLLRALCNQKIGWVNALAELIDNSFNAGATRVVVTTDKRNVRVEDDGRGMLDVSSAVRLGDHKVDMDAGIGMYGIGLKDAWLYAGDSIRVETVRGEERASVSTSVKEMEASGDWTVDAPRVGPALGCDSGTAITLGCRAGRKLPNKEHAARLAWVFTPAIASGKQILWASGRKRKPLAPVDLPPLIDSVTDTFEVSGKEVSICIGIVKDGHHMTSGPLWYQHRHRTICKSHLGVHRYNSERIGGVVKLGHGWSLTKNKDDFDDNKEELGDAIEDRCKMLLSKADQLSSDIETAALTSELEMMVNDAINRFKREKRGKGSSVGSIQPRGTGRRRRNAEKTSDADGSVDRPDSKKRRRTGIKINWQYMDTLTVGDFDPSCNVASLNIRNPFVWQVRSNSKDNKLALFSLAMAVVADHACNNRDGGKTMFEVHDFGQTLGEILKTLAPSVEEAISA